MNGLTLCGDGTQGHTLVSNLFLDNYMPAANGEYVKVYLYLLRCLENGGPELTISLIADTFDHTESDVQRALRYWEKMKLLRLQYDGDHALTGIQLLSGETVESKKSQTVPTEETVSDPSAYADPAASAAHGDFPASITFAESSLNSGSSGQSEQKFANQNSAAPKAPEQADSTQAGSAQAGSVPAGSVQIGSAQGGSVPAGSSQSGSISTSYAPAGSSQKAAVQAAQQTTVSMFSPAEAQQLLFICEQYIGKTLSQQDVAKLLDFHDSLGFDADLIEYLVEYCVSKQHRTMRYIEKVALAWHQDGITDVTEARERTNIYNKAYFSILKAFGITGRNPVDVEITHMKRWLKDYGFSPDLITEACSRTMAAIHQPSFEYAEKILRRWHDNKVTSMAELEALDRERDRERERQNARQAEEKSAAEQGGKSSGQQKSAQARNRFHNFKERDYDFQELEQKLIRN